MTSGTFVKCAKDIQTLWFGKIQSHLILCSPPFCAPHLYVQSFIKTMLHSSHLPNSLILVATPRLKERTDTSLTHA